MLREFDGCKQLSDRPFTEIFVQLMLAELQGSWLIFSAIWLPQLLQNTPEILPTRASSDYRHGPINNYVESDTIVCPGCCASATIDSIFIRHLIEVDDRG
jgi:hypothetical protein